MLRFVNMREEIEISQRYNIVDIARNNLTLFDRVSCRIADIRLAAGAFGRIRNAAKSPPNEIQKIRKDHSTETTSFTAVL